MDEPPPSPAPSQAAATPRPRVLDEVLPPEERSALATSIRILRPPGTSRKERVQQLDQLAASGERAGAAGLAQLFAHIDVDGSGTLEREEIAAMSKELGNDLTERELDLAMAAMDEDGSGGVDLEEFTAWCVSRPRLSRSAVAFCLSVARRSDAIRSASGCPHPLRCCLVLLATGMKT